MASRWRCSCHALVFEKKNEQGDARLDNVFIALRGVRDTAQLQAGEVDFACGRTHRPVDCLLSFDEELLTIAKMSNKALRLPAWRWGVDLR